MTLKNYHQTLRNASRSKRGPLDVVEQLLGGALCRVLTDDASLVPSNGASQTISVYEIDWTTGDVIVAGTYGTIAAGNDQDLLSDVTSYQLDGSAAVALSADGKTYEVALVVIDVNGTPTLFAVFGDEADDGSEVAPTGAEVYDALVAAAPANWDESPGLIVGRITIQRVATDTITMTHTDPASDDPLKQERVVGSVY